MHGKKEKVLHMIKGLYFKLNMDNPYDKEIYDFFIHESELKDTAKIDVLYDVMISYKDRLNSLKGSDNK